MASCRTAVPYHCNVAVWLFKPKLTRNGETATDVMVKKGTCEAVISGP